MLTYNKVIMDSFCKVKIVKENLLINTKNLDLEAVCPSKEELSAYYEGLIPMSERSKIVKVTVYGLGTERSLSIREEKIRIGSSIVVLKDIDKITLLQIHDDLYGRHLRVILELLVPARAACGFFGKAEEVGEVEEAEKVAEAEEEVEEAEEVEEEVEEEAEEEAEEVKDPLYEICLPNHFEAFDMEGRLIDRSVVLHKLTEERYLDRKNSSLLLVIGKSYDREFKNPVRILGLTQIKLSYFK